MGLRNMYERMDAFDGTLEIKAGANGGLRVTATLPIQNGWTEPENDNDASAKDETNVA
jgi:signal transduction histidine kinase